MSKLIIMSGLPASGKSTRAKELVEEYGNTVRINKDLLRTMLHFDKFTGNNEGHTRDAARKLADWFLLSGMNVIIDDTNLNPSTLQSWKDLAKLHVAKLEYHDMETSVEECVKRDAIREKKVGQHVIKKMALQYKDYLKGEKVVICDLDGTIADITHRLQYVKEEPKDWKKFFSLIHNDELRRWVADQVEKTLNEHNAKLIYVSARPETYREESERWLELNWAPYYELLIMRGENDKREDSLIKAEIYEKYLRNLDIVAVFDDRPRVIRMWKEKGLNVVDCGSGIEF